MKEYQYEVSFYKNFEDVLWFYCGDGHWSKNSENQMIYTIKKTKKFIKAHLKDIFIKIGITDNNVKIMFD